MDRVRSEVKADDRRARVSGAALGVASTAPEEQRSDGDERRAERRQQTAGLIRKLWAKRARALRSMPGDPRPALSLTSTGSISPSPTR